jgi:hypothetical protein
MENNQEESIDKGVRFLNKIREKTLKSIYHSATVETNVLKAVVVHTQDDVIQDQLNVYVKFELNGRPYEVRKSIEKRDFKETLDETAVNLFGANTVYEATVKLLSEAIAVEIIDHNLASVEAIGKSMSRQQ